MPTLNEAFDSAKEKFVDYRDKVRASEPMTRRFNAAGLGVASGIVSAFTGFIPSVAFGVATLFVLDSFTHVKDDPTNFKGPKLNSSDYWRNLGAWFAASIVVSTLLSPTPAPEQDNNVLEPQGSLEQLEQNDTVQFGSNGTAAVVTYKL